MSTFADRGRHVVSNPFQFQQELNEKWIKVHTNEKNQHKMKLKEKRNTPKKVYTGLTKLLLTNATQLY
jgi:hypothetical protein